MFVGCTSRIFRSIHSRNPLSNRRASASSVGGTSFDNAASSETAVVDSLNASLAAGKKEISLAEVDVAGVGRASVVLPLKESRMLLETVANVESLMVENDSINTKKHINKMTRSAKVTIQGGAEREFFSTRMNRSG